MSWHTHPLVIWSRSVGRHAGVNRLIARLRQPAGYEARFERAMFAALRPGDSVWDVGANVGRYTAAFALRVGSAGHVHAFEPSPVNFARLAAHVAALDNVTALRLALGDSSGDVSFEQGADELGATSRIAATAGDAATETTAAEARGRFLVPIARGSDLVKSGRARRPTFIKIDTEGHELEVVRGLDELLDDPALRVLCIEVHFAQLAQSQRAHAPRAVERALAKARFQLSWPDASHLLGERKRS